MNEIKMFSVFDKKTLAYMQPSYFHNKGEALRAFEDLCADTTTKINRHPADFSLWIIGSFNDITGALTSLPKPEFLEEALNLVKKEK